MFSKELWIAFKESGKQDSKEYILSAYVSANQKRIVDGYNVKAICKLLNYLSVATFDYTTSAEAKTGHNSPLYSHSEQDSNNIVSNGR